MTRPIRLQIKRLPHANGVDLPRKMTEHAAGFDLCAAVQHAVLLEPGQIGLIPCGFAMSIPHGHEAQVRPRSGLASR